MSLQLMYVYTTPPPYWDIALQPYPMATISGHDTLSTLDLPPLRGMSTVGAHARFNYYMFGIPTGVALQPYPCVTISRVCR